MNIGTVVEQYESSRKKKSIGHKAVGLRPCYGVGKFQSLKCSL